MQSAGKGLRLRAAKPITRSADAQLRTRRVHPIARGDIVEVRGVVEPGRSSHQPRGTPSGRRERHGHDRELAGDPRRVRCRPEPPRARRARATVARINAGQACRAESAALALGDGARHRRGRRVLRVRVRRRSVRRRPARAVGRTTCWRPLRANTSEAHAASEGYDQAGRSADGASGRRRSSPIPHLAGSSSTPAPACSAQEKLVCRPGAPARRVPGDDSRAGARVAVTVRGKHRPPPGTTCGWRASATPRRMASTPTFWRRNAEHRVALPADAGSALNRLDWNTIWDASPRWGADVSKFQIDLNATAGGAICAARGGADGRVAAERRRRIERRAKRATRTLCIRRLGIRAASFCDADLSPQPGDAFSEVPPYAQKPVVQQGHHARAPVRGERHRARDRRYGVRVQRRRRDPAERAADGDAQRARPDVVEIVAGLPSPSPLPAARTTTSGRRSSRAPA